MNNTLFIKSCFAVSESLFGVFEIVQLALNDFPTSFGVNKEKI
jgi:hypothetical protein